VAVSKVAVAGEVVGGTAVSESVIDSGVSMIEVVGSGRGVTVGAQTVIAGTGEEVTEFGFSSTFVSGIHPTSIKIRNNSKFCLMFNLPVHTHIPHLVILLSAHKLI
jgi:hypothetical protein